MSEWKDLTIDNIKEFMENEVELRNIVGKELTSYDKPTIIYNMLKDFYEYQFRLKPLKPIQITAEALRDLYYMFDTDFKQRRLPDMSDIENKYGRKVEIID